MMHSPMYMYAYTIYMQLNVPVSAQILWCVSLLVNVVVPVAIKELIAQLVCVACM